MIVSEELLIKGPHHKVVLAGAVPLPFGLAEGAVAFLAEVRGCEVDVDVWHSLLHNHVPDLRPARPGMQV